MALTGKLRTTSIAALTASALMLAAGGAMAGAHAGGGSAGGPFGQAHAGFDFASFKDRLPEGCRPEKHDRSVSREDQMKRMTESLGLTGQQQQDIQIVTSDYLTRFQELSKVNRSAAEQLAATEPEDANYWPLTQELSASAAQAAGESVVLMSEMRQKLSQILTAEQRAKLKSQMQAKAEEMKARCKPADKEAE